MAVRIRRYAAVATAAVAAVTVFAAGCGASAGDDKEPEHRSFALEGRALTVDSDDSALELVAADVDKVKVTRWFQGSVVVGGDPKVSWEMKGDALKLREDCTGVIADCSTKYRIEVPRGIAVTVKDGDGSVRASGFEEGLKIRTVDGSVHVTDTSGPLNLHTGDGSVRVKDTSGPLTLRTGDGSITATEVDSRRVDVNTQDGSVKLGLAAVPDRVASRSEDGSVTIELPRQAKYRVTAETGDGSVDVSVPRDHRSAHEVSAETRDGKVTVRTAN